MTTEHRLIAHAITLGYGDSTIVDSLDLEVAAGRVTAIVGANGCGKSTLLRALARLISPRAGSVLLDGVMLQQRSSKEIARVLGLLPQNPVAPDGITVAELVGRGRYPHQRRLAPWSRHDHDAVAEALRVTDTLSLADRSIDELSGGQRQRVWIAMALAQETDILLLDEPTTFLDLTHQIEILDLLTDLNRTRGTTVVMVLHDLNLAVRYADVLVAVRAGRIHAHGDPRQIVTGELVRDVFDLESNVIVDPVSGAPLVVPIGRHHTAA